MDSVAPVRKITGVVNGLCPKARHSFAWIQTPHASLVTLDKTIYFSEQQFAH